MALGLAALAWLAFLIVIWRGGPHENSSLRAAVVRRGALTVAIAVATVTAGVWVDEVVRFEEEFLIAALILATAAGTVCVWLPLFVRGFGRAAVVADDERVNVHCPQCGYSLVGLRELRCPECGQAFTIDELIRAQHYEEPAPRRPRVIGE